MFKAIHTLLEELCETATEALKCKDGEEFDNHCTDFAKKLKEILERGRKVPDEGQQIELFFIIVLNIGFLGGDCTELAWKFCGSFEAVAGGQEAMRTRARAHLRKVVLSHAQFKKTNATFLTREVSKTFVGAIHHPLPISKVHKFTPKQKGGTRTK